MPTRALSPNGRRSRRRSSARRQHRGYLARWCSILLVVAVGLVAAVISPMVGMASHIEQAYAKTTVLRPSREPQTTLVFDRNGHLIGALDAGINRQEVPLADIASSLEHAVVAVEDRHFYQEGGISLRGILRAAWEDLAHRRLVQGGSTITQQFVKLEYTGGAHTIGRKVREAMLAVRLAHLFTKNQILEMYLNAVYFGDGAYGAQTAAETYFRIPARQLTVDQSALLAGMVQAPAQYDPFTDPVAATARRNLVLELMAQQGYISSATAAELEATSLGVRRPSKPRTSPGDYFLDATSRALQQRFGYPLTFTGGLRVTTTLDSGYERAARHAIEHQLPSPRDPSAALVAIDPRTGAVRAFIGGRNFRKIKFDLASEAHRQAGSAFKVFTLVAALEKGISLGSVWNGPPSITIPDPKCLTAGLPWHVANYADESAGTMSLAQAIAHSVNTIFAQVVTKVGPSAVVRAARDMGISSRLAPVCSITLGSQAVTPLEMTEAYATLAARGVRRSAQFVASVRGPSGQSMFQLSPRGRRAMPTSIADRATYALEGVIQSGTGVAANIARPAAGKTGTAQNFQDAWFCGYVPQLAACVWVGYPKGELPLRDVEGWPEVFGGSIPARIWHEFMTKVLAHSPVENFTVPFPLPGGLALP